MCTSTTQLQLGEAANASSGRSFYSGSLLSVPQSLSCILSVIQAQQTEKSMLTFVLVFSVSCPKKYRIAEFILQAVLGSNQLNVSNATNLFAKLLSLFQQFIHLKPLIYQPELQGAAGKSSKHGNELAFLTSSSIVLKSMELEG